MLNEPFPFGTSFARIFHVSPVAMTITTLDDGRYIDANEAFAALVGVRREELVNSANPEFRLSRFLGEDPAVYDSLIRPLREEKCRLRTAGGEVRHVVVSSQIQEWHSQPYLFTLLQDITDFQQAEEALRASETRSRLVFENIPLPVFVYDRSSLRILAFNEAVVEQYGYSPEELRHMDVLDIRPVEDHEKFLRHLPTMPPDTRGFGVWRHKRKDGRIMEMDVIGFDFTLEGQAARLAVCRDVTEQQEIRRALLASEQRHRIFAETTSDVLWDADIPGDVLEFSAGLTDVFGYHLDSKVPLDWWVSRIHSEERAAVSEGFYAALAGQDVHWSAQYRFRRRDDQYAHVLDRGHIFRDADGAPRQMIGAMVDITRQVEATEAAALAAMDERRRLARDLHDAVTQSLYSLTLLAETARRHARGGDWKAADEYVERLGELTGQSMKELRLLVHELRPSLLEKEGLVGALQARLDAVERHSGIQARLTVNLDRKLPPTTQLQYYRVAEEALNNALKHAAATAVHITIQASDDEVTMEICDNGKGFDPARTGSGGLGLVSMRERLEKMGGRFELITSPGAGTTLRVSSPRQEGYDG